MTKFNGADIVHLAAASLNTYMRNQFFLFFYFYFAVAFPLSLISLNRLDICLTGIASIFTSFSAAIVALHIQNT